MRSFLNSAPNPSRLSWVVAITLGALATGTATAGPVFLPLGNADRLAVVDHARGTVQRTVDGLPAPHGAALTPDGTRLVVGSFAERTPTTKPARPAGMDPAARPGHHAQKSADEAGVATVSVLDAATGAVVQRVDVPGGVHHVSVSPDGRWAVFTHPAYGRVSVVDLVRGELTKVVPTGEGTNYLAFSPDGSRLYVGNADDRTVTVLRVGSWTTAARFSLPMSPGHMAMARDGSRLYIADATDGTVVSMAAESGTVLTRRELGETLHGIALAPDGRSLYVAVTGGDRLVALDPDTLRVRSERRFAAPYHVTAVTDTGRLMVSSAGEAVLHVWTLAGLEHVAAVRIDGIGHQAAHLP